MLDLETPPEGQEGRRALIGYRKGQIEQLEEQADPAGAQREAF